MPRITRLFAASPACSWCGDAHPIAQLCHARPGLTRRSFLFLSAATAALAVVAPPLLLKPREQEFLRLMAPDGRVLCEWRRFDSDGLKIVGSLPVVPLPIQWAHPAGFARVA